MDAAASDRLFQPSAAMATDPARVPAITFPKNSSRLQTMPTAPASVPTFARPSGLSVSFTNSRSSNFVIALLQIRNLAQYTRWIPD